MSSSSLQVVSSKVASCCQKNTILGSQCGKSCKDAFRFDKPNDSTNIQVVLSDQTTESQTTLRQAPLLTTNPHFVACSGEDKALIASVRSPLFPLQEQFQYVAHFQRVTSGFLEVKGNNTHMDHAPELYLGHVSSWQIVQQLHLLTHQMDSSHNK